MRTKHRFTVRPCDDETGRVWDVCENRGGDEPVAVATFPTRSAARASAAARQDPSPERSREDPTHPRRILKQEG